MFYVAGAAPGTAYDDWQEYIHGRGSTRNAAFADGHAKSLLSAMRCTALWKGPYDHWPGNVSRFYCVELEDMYTTVWSDEHKVFTW